VGLLIISACSTGPVDYNFDLLILLAFTTDARIHDPSNYIQTNTVAIMDTRELDSTIKALQKAVNEKEPVANVVTILENLKSKVNATEELLRATKAGMVVAKQRGHANKEVARLASEIVQKWKKTVEAEKIRKTRMAAASPPKSSPAPESKTFTGDASKRRWETEKVDVKRTGVPSRDACIGVLYNGLAFNSKELASTIILKAIDIEQAAFDHYKGDTNEYRAKLRSLFLNLKNKTDTTLGPRVLSGEIPPARFVTMSADELKSEKQRKEEERLTNENLKNAQVPMPQKSISDALTCGKCRQKKVSYSQAQTRSADEPMTTFCECTICGNRWKFS